MPEPSAKFRPLPWLSWTLPPPATVMFSLTWILPAADRVSVELWFQVIGAATTMLPAWLPDAPVETTTLPIASCWTSVAALSTLSSACAVKFDPPVPAMVRLYGSRRSVPQLPSAARRSALPE